jgi:putative transposase
MHQQKYERSLRQKQLPTIWEVPDVMWERIEPLLPPEKPPGTPGRPVVPYRKVVNGVLYVLRTGCQWKAVPDQYGSGSTVHRRFQEWTQAGIFDAIVQMVLKWYDQALGLVWKWQSGDTKLLPAPLGGEATGPNPTDLGKCGTKRHVLVDGNGAPLAFHLTAANRHDVKGLPSLLTDGWLIERPEPDTTNEQHICLDKAYDDQKMDQSLHNLGYILHVKRRGEDDISGIGEPVHPARRWKVERTISWLNNMRKLRVRWEKKAANYRALWLFASALIVYRLIVLG